ncbi:unnamed protein product [Eruca vesicaria subsp. sativa]|uniref:Uncharacterized protein n=1 Tax=Eruca vesicaria subsp. sativa TaxID=29727 RepID=A0ABC8IZC6_ERUVS|nr:unnamed protein product [Eruca vesicaria subsp. sativa]
MKQKRVSHYYMREEPVDNERSMELETRVGELEKTVAWMKKKLLRRKRTGVTPKKGVLWSGESKKKKKKKIVQMPTVSNLPVGNNEVFDDDCLGKSSSDGGREVGKAGDNTDIPGDGKLVQGSAVSDVDVEAVEEFGEDKSDGGIFLGEPEADDNGESNEMEGLELDDDDSSSEPPEEMLVPLKEGDGVPQQWVEKSLKGHGGAVLYRATTSKTFYVTEDDGSTSVGDEVTKCGSSINEKVSSGGEETGNSLVSKSMAEESEVNMDLGGLNKLVGALVKEHGSKFGELKGGEGNVHGSEQTGEAADEGVEADVADRTGAEVEEQELDGKGADRTGAEAEGVGSEKVDASVSGEVRTVDESHISGKEMVTYVSDSSPCPRSKKHMPIESEADLAALLLAKAPYSLEQIVPAEEDVDFGYFKQVLLANPKVLHLGTGKYDLDNEFFLELATPRKWVSSKV